MIISLWTTAIASPNELWLVLYFKDRIIAQKILGHFEYFPLMSSTAIKSASASELAQNEADTEQLGFDFELHYDLHGKSLQDISSEILQDSSYSKHIHNWDKNLLPSPVHAIAKVGAKYLREKAYGILVTHSAVEEVLPASWANRSSTAVRLRDDIDSWLFFAKKALRRIKMTRVHLNMSKTDLAELFLFKY